jgi:1-aminocyclopropane-1-carboxylate deaminase
MLVGFAKDNRANRVIGIDASGTPDQTRAQVLEIACHTASLVKLGRQISDDDLVRKGYVPAGSKILYAHLGGVPAINGYSYLYRNG